MSRLFIVAHFVRTVQEIERAHYTAQRLIVAFISIIPSKQRPFKWHSCNSGGTTMPLYMEWDG